MAFIGNQIITLNSLLDLDGQELVLDADADTTIHVSTDDQIDFKIAGTDFAKMSDQTLTLTSATASRPGLLLLDTNADANPPFLRFQKDSASPADNDEVGVVQFYADDDGGNVFVPSQIKVVATDVSNGSEDGKMTISTTAGGSLTDTLVLESGNTTVSGTLASTGVLTANAGVVVDNITIDGTEIDLSSGDLTLDSAGDVILSAAGGEVRFDDGSQQEFVVDMNDADTKTVLRTLVSDADLVFEGNDGGVGFEAMYIDMSEGGRVGIGTTSAAAKLHVQSGDGSISPSVHADELLVEGSANSGITIGSGTSGLGSLRFADSGGDSQGNIAYDHSDNSLKIFTADSEAIRIISDGKVGIGGFNPAANLHVGGTGTPEIRLQDTDTSGGSLKITHNAGTSNISADPDNSSGSPTLTFSTVNSERVRIDSSGHLSIGTTSNGGSSGLTINASAFTGGIKIFGGNGQVIQSFEVGGNVVGRIEVNNAATIYSTSSDYRLKENVITDWDATSRLKQLKPSRFNFKTDKATTMDGFLAHEVSGIIPEAITGEKDAVDADGNIDPQGIDQSKLVPLLTKALQEAVSEIDTLKEKVTALESK